jgi:uncharacterized membrane protein YgcG
MRWIKHLFLDDLYARRAFGRTTLAAIEQAIAAQEKRHRGELRFVVEGGLPVLPFVLGRTAHQRALEVFSLQRVWDTEDNAGVLIYLLLADRRVEIVADRGIDARVGDAAWDAICRGMQSEFAAGRFEAGAKLGIEAISDLLALHFPPGEENANELPDAPIVL